jgi:hypothetical protein
LLISISAEAQITRGSADGVDTTDYGDGSEPDSLFVFNIGNSDPYIEAVSPDGTDRTFSWYEYNPVSGNYEFLINESGTRSSVDITGSAGYRVDISGDNTYQCWALLNDFSVAITSTDEEQKIRESDILCGYINQIIAEIDSSLLYYYNPATRDQLQYHVDYHVSIDDWHSNPYAGYSNNIFQKHDNTNLRVAVDQPNWEDTWYRIEITDEFGLVRKDSAFHESKQPHAAFSDPMEHYIYLDDSSSYPDKSERYYEIYDQEIYDNISAPAKFRFINESVNADKLTWFFGDSTTSETQNDTIIHTYMLPGDYYPVLVVSTVLPLSINPCIDTFPGMEDIAYEPIKVENPAVDGGEDLGNWPNVFTPPNGEIEYFRFTGDVSITNFDISIYNRYGKRVYEYQGNVRDWEGWNGRIKGTGRYVSTGVYYYVIKEMYELPNFDPEIQEGIEPGTKRDMLTGFVHVYNTE